MADAAYFEITSAEIETTKELDSGIIADYDASGHIVGIEILAVSKRGNTVTVRDTMTGQLR